ncbi:MAG: class I SAM-dependent methyltransferase [Gammaproteobacteria bacterium]|nr:class I SAM-dependent methyltransferase [Gammaproteobacteria bacterium]
MMNDSVRMAKGLNQFHLPEYRKLVSDDIVNSVRRVEYFAEGHYANLNIADTLAFYTDRYVKQILDFSPINSDVTIVDVGAGFGWLAMAFAYATDAKIIAIEPNKARLDAGKKIANILGIGDRIDWRVGGLQRIPLKDKEADIVYCIEVLEHVYRSNDAVSELCRVSKDLVVLTTPNLWFPVIAHDTQLPFCHWLPVPVRKIYAKLFNRTNRENDNLFWSPYTLTKKMQGFKPISDWLHYSSYEKFLDTFPYYLPYGEGSYIKKISAPKKIYYSVVSRLGLLSHFVVPSLSYVFQRSEIKALGENGE